MDRRKRKRSKLTQTEKEIETFHVPKTSPDKKEADVVLDFKKVSVFPVLHLQ